MFQNSHYVRHGNVLDHAGKGEALVDLSVDVDVNDPNSECNEVNELSSGETKNEA